MYSGIVKEVKIKRQNGDFILVPELTFTSINGNSFDAWFINIKNDELELQDFWGNVLEEPNELFKYILISKFLEFCFKNDINPYKEP